MACQLCSCLVIDYTKVVDHMIPVPYEVQDVYPGLLQLNKTAEAGCELCRLLVKLLGEYFDVTERSLERPVHLELKNVSFRVETYQTEIEEFEDWEVNGVYHICMELVYGDTMQELFFAVFAADNAKFSRAQYPMRRRLRRPIEEDPLSARSVSRMREWIHDCTGNHSTCVLENKSFIPTRLVDIRDGIVLRETRDAPPVEYVALSHCWGTHLSEERILMTTLSTLDAHTTNIPFDALPRNFQDAVKVTRALGYDFIWIDSLCIIQDCLADWEHESAQMAEVYKYATVTLVPTTAKSCHDGFLHHRTIRSARIPYVRPTDGVPDGQLLLQLTDSPASHYYDDVETSWWSHRGWTLQESLLSRRILQFGSSRMYFECKDFLRIRAEGDEPPVYSPKISEFNPEFWASHISAKSATDSESGATEDDELSENGGFSGSDTSSVHDSDSQSTETAFQYFGDCMKEYYDGDDLESPHCSFNEYRVFQHWYRIIIEYTSRELTYEEDKLPATEGLARNLAKTCSVGRYLAGIWENDLALGLLWESAGLCTAYVDLKPWRWPPPSIGRLTTLSRSNTLLELLVKPPERYRAPTWSWASLDGRIVWPSYPQFETNYQTLSDMDTVNGEVQLLSYSARPLGNSVFGRLQDARLTLMAKYQRVSLSGPRSWVAGNHYRYEDSADDYRNTAYRLSVYNALGDEFGLASLDRETETLPTEEIFAIRLVKIPAKDVRRDTLTGLLLQRSVEKPGTFERIGVFVLRDDHPGAFDDVFPEPITLV